MFYKHLSKFLSHLFKTVRFGNCLNSSNKIEHECEAINQFFIDFIRFCILYQYARDAFLSCVIRFRLVRKMYKINCFVKYLTYLNI